MSQLDVEADRFATDLTALFRAVIDDGVSFESVATPGSSRVKVGPAPFTTQHGFALVPLWRTVDDRTSRTPPLQLRVEYALEMDREAIFPQVVNSAFGLWVCTSQDRSARPLFRIEYDRGKTRKPPAHVHFHSESAELAWIYGSAHLPLPRFEEVHFPVGGRRFRPTIEDVLLFLREEQLFDRWRPEAARAIRQSVERWEERQARATARAFPAATADELRRQGWIVSAPAEEPPPR